MISRCTRAALFCSVSRKMCGLGDKLLDLLHRAVRHALHQGANMSGRQLTILPLL